MALLSRLKNLMKASVNNNQPSAVLLFSELRSRLIYSLIVLFLLFAVLIYFANDLYTLLAAPLVQCLPQGHLIATQVLAPFFVPFKLAFMTAIILAAPFFFYQGWAFVAPALYGHERKMLWPFLLMSVLLFYAGIMFAYFVIFPMLFQFIAKTVPQGVMLSPDINEYLEFTTKLSLIFGVLFEIPVIMVLLVFSQLVTRERFINMRSYALLSAFIVGMLIAPPDVLSQTLLALPIWLLYELGIFVSYFFGKKVKIKNEIKK